MKIAERIYASIIYGQIGDAIGMRYENQSSIDEVVIPDQFSLSDDSQLTLSTYQSIIQSKGLSVEDCANGFLSLFNDGGITGMGASTMHAMKELKAGIPWYASGKRGEYAAGNGAAMRISPLIEFVDPFDPENRRTIRDYCRFTHQNEEAYSGALAVLMLMKTLGEGGSFNKALAKAGLHMFDSHVRDIVRIMRESSMGDLQTYIKSQDNNGYVVDTIDITFRAIKLGLKEDSFQVMLKIIQCGGDADTNASIYGNVIGYVQGLSAIPESILEKVPNKDEIFKLAQDIEKLVI